MKKNLLPVQKLIYKLLFLILFLLLYNDSIALTSYQQDTVRNQGAKEQPVYYATRLTTAKPVIDGKLDDPCWDTGTWARDYHQFVPDEGAEPTYPTAHKILYDDKYLYVAFRAYDGEPEKILRHAGVRDEFAGDIVGVNFDSYRDYRTGFEFNLTAWGQKIDLVLFNPMDWDYNWDAVWNGKVGLEDSAWVAEFEIPLSQLRYSNKDEQVWGMHTWRWIDRLQEESNWERQSKTGPGMLYNFGELRGIRGLKKSRRLEILPYALGDLQTYEKSAGSLFDESGHEFGGNMGLDAKIGISSNYTLDITVNPDFGQVESDPSVMNLTAFETFYEEKRPFFLEGLTIFDYKFDDQILFYSRRIGHSPSLTVRENDTLRVKSPDMTSILSAVKFSGTDSKGLSVGVIQSLTAKEYAKVTDQYGNESTRQVEPLTNYMVARVQKGFNAGTSVLGGMLTSTQRFIDTPELEFLPGSSYTGGLDLIHRWRDKEFFLDARLIGSYVTGSDLAIRALQESSARYYQRPGASYLGYDTTRTSLSGYGGRLNIGKGAKGFWRYSTGITWLSPGLEMNDLGYMRTADNITNRNELSYFVNQPVSIFQTYDVGLEQYNIWNFNGTFLGSGGHLSFSSKFMNNWSLSTGITLKSGAYDTRLLRGGSDMKIPGSISASGSLRTDPSKNITAGVRYNFSASGNRSAESHLVEPNISIRPLMRLRFRISASYSENYDELQYVSTIHYSPGKRYILGSIDQHTLGLTFRVDLNITPELSIQYYGSPFVSKGRYYDFKRITDPAADSYEDRFSIFSDPVLSSGRYLLDENNDMIADYSVVNPDFNFHQFRSNLVAKWEYRLGSFIYLVWSSERTGLADNPDASIGESIKQLWKVFPNNIFLIKLNYWFSL